MDSFEVLKYVLNFHLRYYFLPKVALIPHIVNPFTVNPLP